MSMDYTLKKKLYLLATVIMNILILSYIIYFGVTIMSVNLMIGVSYMNYIIGRTTLLLDLEILHEKTINNETTIRENQKIFR